MKKLLTLTAVGAILATPAMAVKKCVALNSSDTTCTSSYSDYSGKAEWEATCTTNGTSVPIKGVGVCSSAAAEIATPYSDDLLPTISLPNDTTNINCWCKIISPVVSPWIYQFSLYTAGTCMNSCAYQCAYATVNSAVFRSAMLSTLSD